jgi:hypothetical protein
MKMLARRDGISVVGHRDGRPEARDAAGTAHLAGFDRAPVPAFVWPPEEVTSAAPQ